MSTGLRRTRRSLSLATIVAGVLTVIVFAAPAMQSGDMSAWIVSRKTQEIPWKIIEGEEIAKGVTVPPDTNVIFHMPLDGFFRIPRKVLVGPSGESVRYWGYCLPENYDASIIQKRIGFPGQMFLSEAERDAREAAAERGKSPFTILRWPKPDELAKQDASKLIRHQIEIFKPGHLCYIMTDEPLPIGLDDDGDTLNNKLELDAGTDAKNPDTDGDGVWDGVEVATNTNVAQRDTDGDGLIDGVEDKNFNGKVDSGETDPREFDTDRDGLCDGSCRMRLANRQTLYYGEDTNLNGKADEDESDPTMWDSDDDGVSDYQAFLNCTLGVQEYCL